MGGVQPSGNLLLFFGCCTARTCGRGSDCPGVVPCPSRPGSENGRVADKPSWSGSNGCREYGVGGSEGASCSVAGSTQIAAGLASAAVPQIAGA